MAATAILDFFNRKILLAIGVQKIEMHQQPNFVKIGQSVAKIIKIFPFFKIAPSPSWIVGFTKFYWLTLAGWPRHITLPNFVKIAHSIAEMLQFFEF